MKPFPPYPPALLEFDRIARHFRPLAGPGSLHLTDDAALMTPPPGRQLVICADALVEGVHFLPTDPPETLGRKMLRVSLSDLAAMGADPLSYLMTIALPRRIDEAWLASFAAGLALDQAEFAITLLGGDTTSTPGPICLSATLLGHVAPGQALLRSGARPGDGIWVTGTIGDGVLGLLACQGKLADSTGFLASRYRIPQPRLGVVLAGIASAAMDVSDGLVQDLGHICAASGCAATIEAALVPLSPAARAAIEAGAAKLATCLAGGDDYELLLSVPAAQTEALRSACAAASISVKRIGTISAGAGAVTVLDQQLQPMALASRGWSHF